jgi:PncC family amidohydrolase
LEGNIGRELSARSRTLAVAESCTGGLLAHRLTNVPGSSAYFRGGVVAYDPAVKRHLVGVRSQTLVDHGAVSAEVAIELAEGVRQLLATDIGIGVTGVAGPGGGTPEKPVGLIFIALAADGHRESQKLFLSRDRLGNKQEAAQAALAMLDRYLRSSP